MRVAVTGGRDFDDFKAKAIIWGTLDAIHAQKEITLLIHGACHLGGADITAENWAKEREVPYFGMPAKFKTGSKGKVEGPLRNHRMLDTTKPDVLIAFPGGSGTAGCAEYATRTGLKVFYVENDGAVIEKKRLENE